MLEQLVVQQRTLLERMRVEGEQLAKLQKTKNSIDGDIAKLELSLNACTDAKEQLESTIANAQAGYKQMIESGNTLLQLATRSIEGMKSLQNLPAEQIMPPPPHMTHPNNHAMIARQEVSNELDLAAQTQAQAIVNTAPRREPFTWYDSEYYNNLS